jgi:hypothetical protein
MYTRTTQIIQHTTFPSSEATRLASIVTANTYREDVADLDLVVVAHGPRGGQRLVAEAAGQGDVRGERAHLRGADGLRVGGVEGAPAARPRRRLQRIADRDLGRVLLLLRLRVGNRVLTDHLPKLKKKTR